MTAHDRTRLTDKLRQKIAPYGAIFAALRGHSRFYLPCRQPIG